MRARAANTAEDGYTAGYWVRDDEIFAQSRELLGAIADLELGHRSVAEVRAMVVRLSEPDANNPVVPDEYRDDRR
jgi:hypothetical protein